MTSIFRWYYLKHFIVKSVWVTHSVVQRQFPASCMQTRTRNITLISHKEGISISFVHCCIPRMQNSACNITRTPYIFVRIVLYKTQGSALFVYSTACSTEQHFGKYEILFSLTLSSIFCTSKFLSNLLCSFASFNNVKNHITIYNFYSMFTTSRNWALHLSFSLNSYNTL